METMIIGKISTDWAKRAGLPYWYQEATTSTNDQAKEMVLTETENIRIYFTEHQSSGRGRGTNNWQTTDPGTCLLSSWSFLTQRNPQPILSPLMGLALYRALQATFPQLSFSIKAPNDIYLGDKKVAGILLENVVQGSKNRLIIGLGLNVYTHPPLSSATCLSQHLEELIPQDWAQLLDRILLEFTMAISSAGSTLALQSQAALLFALNRNPHLAAPYLKVSAHGDLETASTAIPWGQL